MPEQILSRCQIKYLYSTHFLESATCIFSIIRRICKLRFATSYETGNCFCLIKKISKVYWNLSKPVATAAWEEQAGLGKLRGVEPLSPLHYSPLLTLRRAGQLVACDTKHLQCYKPHVAVLERCIVAPLNWIRIKVTLGRNNSWQQRKPLRQQEHKSFQEIIAARSLARVGERRGHATPALFPWTEPLVGVEHHRWILSLQMHSNEISRNFFEYDATLATFIGKSGDQDGARQAETETHLDDWRTVLLFIEYLVFP